MVNLTINGLPTQAEEGTTILQAAEKLGVFVPRLCYWKGLNQIGACRMCVVEVEGNERLAAACDAPVEEGMVVHTDSPRVIAARKTTLRLILSQHNLSCKDCLRTKNCVLQSLFVKLKVNARPYDLKLERKRVDPNSPIIREADKCVKCMRCVQVCDKMQTVHIWDVLGNGARVTVGATGNLPLSQTLCTYCGQCVTHCPVGALTARDDSAKVHDMLTDPSLNVVFQFGSTVPLALKETSEYSATSAKRLVAGLKRIGAAAVFNSDMAADVIIVESARELIERLKSSKSGSRPLFTSTCPAWVRFIKGQFPDSVGSLSTLKSPSQILGSLVKRIYPEKTGIDPHSLRVVSVVPCVAEKSACTLNTMKEGCGDNDVDVVLTTRELTRLLRSMKSQMNDIVEEDFDEPFDKASASSAISNVSGGLMDAVLHSAIKELTDSNPETKNIRNIFRSDDTLSWKEATIALPDIGDIRVAVVSGLGNARNLMEALENGEAAYDYVEVMACPGGCVGGGGQPIHEGEERAVSRGDVLWRLDSEKTNRFAYENDSVEKLYTNAPSEGLLRDGVFSLAHTDHAAWNMPEQTEN